MRDERKTKAQLLRELRTLRVDLKKAKRREQRLERVEGALRDSGERHRLLFENSAEAILETQPDGQVYAANKAACRLFGRTEAEIKKIGRSGVVETSDPRLKAALKERMKTGKAKTELNLIRSDGRMFPAEVSSVVFKDSHGNRKTSMFISDISERKQAEDERSAHIRFLEAVDRIDRAIRREKSVQKMLHNTVKAAFSIFGCDRAWLFYPCDPDAQTFRVPVEITRPEYPGANIQNIDVPMSPEMAENLREAMKSRDPITYTVGTNRPINKLTAEHYGVQSQMVIPLYPRMGKPWVFGMHQCSHPRIWTKEERELFKEISRRISDGLSSFLFLRQLQESEERYRALITHSPDAIYVHVDGRVTMANSAMCKLLGANDSAQLVGKAAFDIVHPDYHDVVRERWKLVFEGQVAPLIEEQFVRLDGTVVDVEVNAVVIDWEGREGIQVIARDITERKRAEEDLRESEERFRAVVENQGEGLGIVDAQERFTLANPAAERIFGVPPGSLVGKNLTDFVTADQWAEIQRQTTVRRSGNKSSYLLQIVRSNWETRDLLVTAVPQLRDGVYLGAYGVFLDITERKRAEESLKQALEWQEAVFEGSRDAVFISDQDSRFVAVNAAACDLTGYTREKLLTMRIPDLHDHPDLDAYKKFHQRILQGEDSLTEAKILRSDGVKVDTEFNNRRVSIAGTLYMHTAARDITERKRVEDNLRQSEDRYRDLVEHSQDLICTHDLDGRLLSVNTAAVKMLGYSEDEITKMNMRDILAPEVQRLFDAYLRRIRRDHCAKGRLVVQTKSGERRIWEYDNTVRANGIPKPFVRGWARDITDRVQAEKELRVSEERFRTLFEQAAVGVALLETKTGRYVRINPKYCDFLGYTIEEMLHKTFQDVTHPDDTQTNVDNNASLIAGTITEFSIEKRYIRNDGTVVWGKLTASPLWTPGTEPDIHLQIAIVEDITERKKAEDALRASESRFRDLWEATVEGITILDGEIIVEANDAVCAMFGYTREQAVGKSFLTFAPPEMHKALRAHIASGIEGRFETPALRAGGVRMMLEVFAKRFLYHGKPMRMVAMRDITERKRAEDALKKERALLSTIIETIPDEICLKDTDSRYIIVNKASVAALGAASAEEIIKKTDLDFVRRDLALRLLAEEKQILESGKPSIGREVVRLDPKTGEISKCDLYTKVPVKAPDGTTVGLLAINMDITQRKRAEENVKRSELRLRQLSAHMESVREEERKHIAQEFHDQLGQTLTALKMDLSLMERAVADETKDIARSALIEDIHSSQKLIDRGIQTVRAIMSELRPELLDQLGLVEALEWEAGKFQQRSGILCGLTADVGDLRVDAKRSIALFRLVQEALTNVARHAQAANVDINLRKEDDNLILEIKDDGIGISFDAENKPRSFGLIGMRERAAFLGGSLEITGTVGKGTKILVRMPIQETLPDGVVPGNS